MGINKLILAAIEPFVASVSGANVQGANVAGVEFLEALLKYGGRRIEKVIFFLGSDADKTAFTNFYHSMELPDESVGVEIQNLSDLPEALRKGEISAFISSSIQNRFYELAQIRNSFAVGTVPIVSFIYSVSYNEFITIYTKFALAGASKEDAVLCISNSGKEVLEKCFQYVSRSLKGISGKELPIDLRLETTYLGIFPEKFGKVERKKARKLLGLPGEGDIVLTMGRFSAYDKMDLMLVLRLAERHFKECPDSKAKFVFAGSRTPNNYLELLKISVKNMGLEEKVFFFPDFESEKKHLFYSAADLFLSLADNFQETFGITLIEGMASGLPVIVSDLNGYMETVLEGETGYKIPTYWSPPEEGMMETFPLMRENVRHLLLAQGVAVDEDVCYQRLDMLLKDRSLREKLGNRAEEHAEKFHWEKIIFHVLSLIMELRKTTPETQPGRGENFFQLPYGEVFDHYCTELLEEDHLFETTERGQEILRQEARYAMYGDIIDFMDTGLLRHILFTCRQQTSLKTIKEKVKQKNPDLQGKTNYHLLWLFKQSYLRKI